MQDYNLPAKAKNYSSNEYIRIWLIHFCFKNSKNILSRSIIFRNSDNHLINKTTSF